MFDLFVDSLLNNYIGLVFECPYMEERDDCPFKNIRQMKIENRLKFYKKFNQELIEIHKKCVISREKETQYYNISKAINY